MSEDAVVKEKESTVAKNRMIRMLADLYAGKGIDIERVMEQYKVSKRSIQRDLRELRDFLEEDDITGARTLEYDDNNKLYKAVPALATYLSEKEIYIIIKMLLECRGLNNRELDAIIEKLVGSCLATETEQVHFKNIINRERTEYVAPRHGKDLMDDVWDIQGYIDNRSTIEIEYTRVNGSRVKRTVVPVGLVFSEFYFYMIAYIVESKEERIAKEHTEFFPIIYRVDRIASKKVVKDSGFRIPYEKKFKEGEFRKHIQFMYNGPLRKIKFYCNNTSLEAVLDRLPSAVIVEEGPQRSLVTAEVFGGDGIEMWLKSQEKNIEVVKK